MPTPYICFTWSASGFRLGCGVAFYIRNRPPNLLDSDSKTGKITTPTPIFEHFWLRKWNIYPSPRLRLLNLFDSKSDSKAEKKYSFSQIRLQILDSFDSYYESKKKLPLLSTPISDSNSRFDSDPWSYSTQTKDPSLKLKKNYSFRLRFPTLTSHPCFKLRGFFLITNNRGARAPLRPG